MDNSSLKAKIALRKYFLDKIASPRILELCAGERRELYHACYENLDVTSLDIKEISGVIKIDNKIFIASSDLTEYNFFDLDVYGTPYQDLLNIFKKKSIHPDPFAVIVTDGITKQLEWSACPDIVKVVIENKSGIRIPFLHRHHEFIIKLILQTFSARYNIKITDCKIVRQEQNNKMVYFGVLCQSTI